MSEIAADHGAVFVHHGGSPQGYSSIGELGLYQIDGMRYDGTVFQRDAARRAQMGFEHSSFAAAARLIEHTENRDWDMAARPDLGLFEFFEEMQTVGSAAEIVNIPFHPWNISVFRYYDGLYYKYFLGNPQMDGYADDYAAAQLAVANVLIQVTDIYHIPGDAEGRRNMRLLGEGHGYLATAGTYSRVYWEKPNAHSPTRWFDADGEPLQLNRGITWISIISGQPTFEPHMEE
jgi:hypothetical protein